MSEKTKPMVITDPEESKEYVLEYSRRTAIKVEQSGLDLNAIMLEKDKAASVKYHHDIDLENFLK